MILGQGSYGKVTVRNGRAVKKFAKLAHLVQEYVVLRYVADSEYIVRALGMNLSELELEMELYNMSLRNRLNKGSLSSSEVNRVLHDILLGLIALHDRNLTHGDLKPGNILVNEHPFRAVLADCGFVSVSKYAKVERTAAVYRDPVIQHHASHDIFSFGICYLEIVHGIRNSIQADYRQLHQLVEQRVSDRDQRRLLLRMLSENKDARPTSRELYERLFQGTPPLWDNRVSQYNTPMSFLDDHTLLDLKRRCKELVRAHYVARGKRCYIALVHYLDVRRSTGSMSHIVAAVAITSSLFGTVALRDKDIAYYSEHKSASATYQIMNEMMNDMGFIYLLLSP